MPRAGASVFWGGRNSPAPHMVKCWSGTGEWRLCPSGVTCDPGDGSATLKEVCSLFDIWDCTFSLPVGSKISWLMIILSRTGEILGERVQGTLWSKNA